MTYLTEDPTYVLVALGLAALGCLLALQMTQQGKFLIWAGGIVALAAVVFGVERLIVTNAERVEAVVYALADAVRTSNVAAVEALMEPDVRITQGDQTGRGVAVDAGLPILARVRFDFLRVRQLVTAAGSQTKRGTAEFKVVAGGIFDGGGSMGGGHPFPPTETQWALGFREVAPGDWRVTRISAVRVPGFVAPYLGGRGR